MIPAARTGQRQRDRRGAGSAQGARLLSRRARHRAGLGVREAFHPEAKLFFNRDGKFNQLTSAEYIARASGKPADDEAQRKRRIDFVDVTGDAAVAKITLEYPGVTLTDYMSLIKVDGEWRIVNKIFHANRQPTGRSDRRRCTPRRSARMRRSSRSGRCSSRVGGVLRDGCRHVPADAAGGRERVAARAHQDRAHADRFHADERAPPRAPAHRRRDVPASPRPWPFRPPCCSASSGAGSRASSTAWQRRSRAHRHRLVTRAA